MLTTHGGSQPGLRSGALVTVLVIEDDHEEALRIEEILQSEIPGVNVLSAACVEDARKLVSRCTADLILTQHELSDGGCADVLAMVEDSPEAIPVFAYVRGGRAEAEHIRQEHPKLLDCTVWEYEGSHLTRIPTQYLLAVARVKRSVRPEAPRTPELLRRVRHTISRVNHDLNNPLSIISGNAQLLVELSNALDLDGDLSQPIHDIEEASARVSGILRRLVDLKDQLPVDEATSGDVRAELRDLQEEHQERR